MPIVLFLLGLIVPIVSYSDEKCIDIPRNLSLCENVGYREMKLPNLLGHDTLLEAIQQSKHWIRIMKSGCHKQFKQFLCAQFAPICYDLPIFPCRDLCESVKAGCEGLMKLNGYVWPEIFRCTKFPSNKMCVQLKKEEEGCICNPPVTVENILGTYCMSHTVVRSRFRQVRNNNHATVIQLKNPKVLKSNNSSTNLAAKNMKLSAASAKCCNQYSFAKNSKQLYLIMGKMKDSKFQPDFITPWQAKSSKTFKKAVRMFKKINCSKLHKDLPTPIT